MATSKRPKAKKPKRKSKARQTTLSDFPTLQRPPAIVSGPSSSTVRRSTRGVVSTPDSPPVPSLATIPAGKPSKNKKTIKNEPRQQKLQPQKLYVVPAAAPIKTSFPSPPPPPPPPHSSPPPKSPNFAVVIYTTPKESSRKQNPQPAQTESWFQPGVRIDPNQNTIPSHLYHPSRDKGKGKGKEIASRDTESNEEEEEEEDDDDGPVLDSARKRRGISARVISGKAAGNNRDGSGNDNFVITPGTDSIKGLAKQTKIPARIEVQVGSEDNDEVTAPAPKRRRRSKSDNKSQTKFGHDGHESDDGPVVPTNKKKTLKEKSKDKLVGLKGKEEDDNNELLKPEEVDAEEHEKDLEEDLAFLSTKQHVLSSRTRYNGSSPKKTPFQKKLAELRAKKAGKHIEEDSSSEDNKPKRALYDTDDEDRDDGEDGDGDLEIGDNSNADSDESWIIDDDGSATIGAPDAEIPLEFTRLSHQSTKANFRICCQWVVQSILNPDFPSDDKISQFAIRALDRKIDSYGGSVLQSSIWKAPFMRAMKARPVFETEVCDERPTCDACGKSKRPAAHAVTFSGERYDKVTLENFEGSDAADSEDSAGLSIPDPSTVFYLGRHCHARAQMSHAFIHWKKQLRDAIEGILESQDYFQPLWVNRAAKMDNEERTKWANTVTDNLGDQIKEFYTDLKKGLEAAQDNMTNQRFGTWR